MKTIKIVLILTIFVLIMLFCNRPAGQDGDIMICAKDYPCSNCANNICQDPIPDNP